MIAITLNNERPDHLPASTSDTALNKIPELDRTTVENLILGCGKPAGESGYTLAGIGATQPNMPTVPGVTINRYSSSSLMSTRRRPSLSASVNQRPARRRAPIDSKYPSVTDTEYGDTTDSPGAIW